MRKASLLPPSFPCDSTKGSVPLVATVISAISGESTSDVSNCNARLDGGRSLMTLYRIEQVVHAGQTVSLPTKRKGSAKDMT